MHCGQQISPNVAFCTNCGTPVPGQAAAAPIVPTPGTPVQLYTVVSAGTRFGNYILDLIGLYIFAFCIIFILALTGNSHAINSTLLGIILFWVYYPFFEGIWGRTPGKWITKTKVVMHDGSKPDFAHILGRTLARMIPFEPFSFFAGPIGWHDSLSKTIVVHANYNSDQVQHINLTEAAKTKTSTIIIIVVSFFFFIAIVGLLSSVILLALNSAREKARDEKRIADTQQILSALALYYNDYSQYPPSLGDLPPKYIAALPTPPTPPDGNCTADQNQYQYQQDTGGTNYVFSFCLGEGSSAGMQVMTKDGSISPASSTNSNVLPSGNPPLDPIR